MLNEITELDQYTSAPDENGRLGYTGLVNNTGMVRPMTIIARAYVFKSKRKPDFEKAKRAVKAWCKSRENSNSKPEFPFECWFEDYIDCMIDNLSEDKLTKKQKSSNTDPEAQKIKLREEKLKFSGQERIRNTSIYSVKSNNNDINSIYYDDIIAEAYASGPLKRYYLFVDKDVFELKKNGAIDGLKNVTKGGKRTTGGKVDKYLKIIASLLLSKHYSKILNMGKDSDSEFILINATDTANWFKNGKKSKTLSDIIDASEINGELLFEKPGAKKLQGETGNQKNQNGNNYLKIKVHPDFLKNFCIVEESDFASFRKDHPDWFYFSDSGSNSTLNLNTEY